MADDKDHKEFQELLEALVKIKYEINKNNPELSYKHFNAIQYHMTLLPKGDLKKKVAMLYGRWTVVLKEENDSNKLKDLIDNACKELIKLLN